MIKGFYTKNGKRRPITQQRIFTHAQDRKTDSSFCPKCESSFDVTELSPNHRYCSSCDFMFDENLRPTISRETGTYILDLANKLINTGKVQLWDTKNMKYETIKMFYSDHPYLEKGIASCSPLDESNTRYIRYGESFLSLSDRDKLETIIHELIHARRHHPDIDDTEFDLMPGPVYLKWKDANENEANTLTQKILDNDYS